MTVHRSTRKPQSYREAPLSHPVRAYIWRSYGETLSSLKKSFWLNVFLSYLETPSKEGGKFWFPSFQNSSRSRCHFFSFLAQLSPLVRFYETSVLVCVMRNIWGSIFPYSRAAPLWLGASTGMSTDFCC